MDEQCGTLHYLAPELLQRDYGPEVDLWAVGVLIYLLIYGKYPFRGDNSASILKEIETYRIDWTMQEVQHSPQLVQFVAGLLERDPAKRMTAEQALQHPFILQVQDKKGPTRKANRIIPRHIIEGAAQLESDAVKNNQQNDFQITSTRAKAKTPPESPGKSPKGGPPDSSKSGNLERFETGSNLGKEDSQRGGSRRNSRSQSKRSVTFDSAPTGNGQQGQLVDVSKIGLGSSSKKSKKKKKKDHSGYAHSFIRVWIRLLVFSCFSR
eukprot:Cvel_7576.t2-p1 / transcript=Cvel_7576.t2 / gene=Cvel_7576 / organism=Chromera_velia_CCMP2878 / gene_product=Calcium-dependent protein kinase 24, putative / transcript_product=Calcium-dependent protein kinase 24, putative / location=Cvel_scaffold399:12721-15401(-) / protein_length=265 / sequence_SO=supercontig / SO=protein_coding / is_pseudo=false